jgi:fermentation-respiration switch protein FrsA (DUF1100 family)
MIESVVRKRMWNLLIMLALVYVGFALLIVWREPAMIYYPVREHTLPAPPRAQDVWLTTADGVRIHAWFVPAETNAKLTVLFCHGNAGNIADRLDKLEILNGLGVDVLIFDYRGYGRSEGRPNEHGTYRDAQAAYEHLTKTMNREPRSVIAYGESLGAAIAVDLAAKAPLGGVILEEPFTSVVDVGRGMFPFLPVRWLVRNKYDTLSKIGRVHAPLLILHSRDDEYFPMRHAERLLTAAAEPKRLVELRGGHNDAFLVSAETYRSALRDFFNR